MALLQAYLPFDIENTNFNRTTYSSSYVWAPNQTSMFVDDGMRTSEYGGYWFDDGLSFLYDYDGDSYELAVGGNGLTWNGSGLTGGSLIAIEQTLIVSGNYQLAYEARDFAVSATSFSAARLTASTTDDYSLIQSVFSGNDSIIGSSYSDIVRGYGGSDSIDGAGGTDTAIYSGKFSEYSIAFNKSTLATTITDLVAGRDGVDSLQNIESIKFSDLTVNLTSYQTDTIGPFVVDYSPLYSSTPVDVSIDFTFILLCFPS